VGHYQPLKNFIQQIVAISDEELQELMGILQEKHYKKKAVLTKAGEVESNLYFLTKGVVRIFFLKGKKDVTFDLAKENTITSSTNSLFTGRPSRYTLEALEPVTALVLSKDKLDELYTRSKKWQRFGRLVTTFFLLRQERGILERAMFTPRERFVSFVQNNPEFIQRVSQKHLASYLGIKPETFTRMKRHLMHKKNSKNNHND
jgi:CRP-like cAMP-binding protein